MFVLILEIFFKVQMIVYFSINSKHSIIIFFSGVFLATLGTLYGRGIFPIDREWWDNDYKRLGKTTFKGRIKGIFIALLINVIYFSVMIYLVNNNLFPYAVMIQFGMLFFWMQE